MLLLNGFLFVKDRQVMNETYWKCKDFEKHCKSQTITIDDVVTTDPKEHNHADDPASVEIYKFMNEVREKRKNSREAQHVIISSTASQVSQVVAAALPSTNSIKRAVRRVRQTDDTGLVVPMHRKDLVSTKDQTKTKQC